MAQVGRPPKYCKELQEDAETYLLRCIDLNKAPSLAGLAANLDITRETCYDWKDKYPAFSDTLRKINVWQEAMLLDNGLSGKYNSTITKLMLANHGYSDKQDITTDGKQLPAPIIPLNKED